jgi:hypothetical protein
MKPTEKLKEKWATQRWHRQMDRSFDLFGPYMHLLDTEKGMTAMLMVSGVATGVAMGEAKEPDLDNAVQAAAELSGIPANVLRSHAAAVNADLKLTRFSCCRRFKTDTPPLQ